MTCNNCTFPSLAQAEGVDCTESWAQKPGRGSLRSFATCLTSHGLPCLPLPIVLALMSYQAWRIHQVQPLITVPSLYMSVPVSSQALLLEDDLTWALAPLGAPVNSLWVGLTCVCGAGFLRRSFPRLWASLITPSGLWLLPVLRALNTG